MPNYFSRLEEIKEKEVGVKIFENVFDRQFLRELEEINNSLVAQVDRTDSKKATFSFNDNEKFIKLKTTLTDLIGEFFVNDFKQHFITSRFPLRIHTDSGKDPDDVIGPNILIPINIYPEDKVAHTIIFKNKWYGPSANFVSKKSDGNDHILIDSNNEFVDIPDINIFYEKLCRTPIDETINFSNGVFKVNENLKNEISKLLNLSRYAIRTNEHISKGEDFDRDLYKKYLSHQPYEDLKDLEIHTAYKWKLGDVLVWDRTLIHSSDNYLINGVDHKISIPISTSWIDKPLEPFVNQ